MKTVTIKIPCRVYERHRKPGETLDVDNLTAMRLVAHGWATAGLSHGKAVVEARDPEPEQRDPEAPRRGRPPKSHDG
jgi:hypothetical protein